MCIGDINGHDGRHFDGLDWVHAGYVVGRTYMEGRILLEFYLGKELCVSNTWFKREERRKVKFRIGENKPEIDFVLIKKEHRWLIWNVMAIPREFQRALLVADIDE